MDEYNMQLNYEHFNNNNPNNNYNNNPNQANGLMGFPLSNEINGYNNGIIQFIFIISICYYKQL